MIFSRTNLLPLSALALLLAATHPAHAVVRTLNLDFGNAGAYVGGGGVLSSPGGTHWNPVTVTSFPPGSGISVQFDYSELRDEFGQFFDLDHALWGSFPNLGSGFHIGQETTSLGFGPLNDGVRVSSQLSFFGFSIRQLSPHVPIDVAVYFNNPTPLQPETNTISVNSLFGGEVSTFAPPTGFFPGSLGSDYLLFNGIDAIPTTIGDPPLPGVIVSVPAGGVANIAAIQIRGEFTRVPEPVALTMTLLAAGSLFARRTSQNPKKPPITTL